MDFVHGGISIRFAVVLVCLPMLSPFPIGSPCGERESFQARILGSYPFFYLVAIGTTAQAVAWPGPRILLVAMGTINQPSPCVVRR